MATTEPTTPTFAVGDRVQYIDPRPEHMAGHHGTVVGSSGLPGHHVTVEWDEGARYPRTSEPVNRLALLNPPESAASEITDEQRAAWRNFEGYYPSAAQKLAPLLPYELTGAQQPPPLPTEPMSAISYNYGPTKRQLTATLDNQGVWRTPYGNEVNVADIFEWWPLVRQPEPITREQVRVAITTESLLKATLDIIVGIANRTADS